MPAKIHPNKDYVIQYYDGGNGHTYRFPVTAGSKEGAILEGLGTKARIKRMHFKKIKVTLRKK